MLDVRTELFFERVDPREPNLLAEPVGDLHSCVLAIEVAIEVDEVCLDEEETVLVVERGATTDVDRGRMRQPVGAHVPAGVHAVAGEGNRSWDREVGGREADRSAAGVAVFDDTSHLVRPAQEPIGGIDVAGAYEPADGGRRNHAAQLGVVQQRHRRDLESPVHADPLHGRGVALPAVAEVEVFPADLVASAQSLDHHVGDELVCGLQRHLLVEANHVDEIDPVGIEELEPLRQVGQQRGQVIGGHHGVRVTVRYHHGRTPT